MWRVLNTVIVLVGFLGGLWWKSPDNLRITNSDGMICCFAILCLMPIFAIGSVTYSILRWKCEKLNRPSWDRNPCDWWNDPLQSLFVSTCVMAGMTIGNAFRLPMHWPAESWIVAMFLCAAAGLATGQMIIYRIYKRRIT